MKQCPLRGWPQLGLLTWVMAVVGACASHSEAGDSDDDQAGQSGSDGEGGDAGQAGGDEPPNAGSGGLGGGGAPGAGTAGGAGVDAGVGASGGAAGTPTVPASGGAAGAGSCSTNPVCDDFESYATGKFTSRNGWTLPANSAPVVIDETRARSGKKSIKITVPASGEGGGQSALLSRSDRSVLSTGKSVYARMMVYLENIPSGAGLHWAFLRASGFHAQDGKMGLITHSLGGQPGRLRNLMLWPTSAGLQDCFNDSSTQIASKKWTCVEWHLDPEGQAMEVWFDGQKQSDNSWMARPQRGACAADQTGGKWIIPKLSVMNFGWIHYHTFSGVTMWLDDIAMDTKKVGCPN